MDARQLGIALEQGKEPHPVSLARFEIVVLATTFLAIFLSFRFFGPPRSRSDDAWS
jgi:hypothetical protein